MKNVTMKKRTYNIKQRKLIADILCDVCYMLAIIAVIGIYALLNALDCDVVSFKQSVLFCTMLLMTSAIFVNIGKTMELISDTLAVAIKDKKKKKRQTEKQTVQQSVPEYCPECYEYEYAHTM